MASDLENQEFRECARQLFESEWGTKYHTPELLDLLALAMWLGAEAAVAMSVEEPHKLTVEFYEEVAAQIEAVVASRISSRIKGEK